MKQDAMLTNVAAEKAVLGSLIRSEHDFWKISDKLSPSSFSVPLHRDIYAVMSELLMGGKKLSFTVLGSRLPEEDSNGQSVGAYLATLVANAEGLSVEDFADPVAEAASRRRLVQIAESITKAAKGGEKSAIDVAAEAEAGLLDVMQVSSPKRAKNLAELADRVFMGSKRAKDGEDLPGFDTGLSSLDEIVGLIMPGDLVGIIASQGDGKTSLATQIGMHVAPRRPVLFFEHEMTDEAIAARVLAAEANMPVRQIREGAYTFEGLERLREAKDRLVGPQFWILDDPKMTVRQMRAHCLALKRTVGLGMVIVDHLRLVQGEGRPRDRWDRQTQVTGDLKIMAKELEIAVLLLAQRTRSSQRRDDPMPQIDDADAPSLEQDCDLIIGLWRRYNWLQRNGPSAKAGGEEKERHEQEIARTKGIAEMVSMKRRQGAAWEKRQFKWDGALTRIQEL